MKTTQIRQKFIEFFQSKKHTLVPSASLIPHGDQTILFTIAGMAQFKSLFTGEERRDYTRATNSQKCVRVADLDEVGHDGRHLTFFEMLGSWSFGDYGKDQGISWAYEFVKDVLKLDLDKFWVSVHHSDEESAEIWSSLGVPGDRIKRLGDKDNFWAMGPTGPCGPCTELYYDQGNQVAPCHDPKNCAPGCDCDRFLEFWNLVFMQYDRKPDGTLQELPIKSIDTGCGLERLASIIQGKSSAFDIELFENIQKAILTRGGFSPDLSLCSEKQKQSVRIISDHLRMLVMTLGDGAHFSNEGRGYVLRRVLRRAVRTAYDLVPQWDKKESFLVPLVSVVIAEMGSDFFPELKNAQGRISDAVAREELKFSATLKSGLQKLDQFFSQMKKQNQTVLSGENAFILHDSFGFPVDLTRILCSEYDFTVDENGFQNAMAEQKKRSREEAKFYKFEEDDSPWAELNPLQASEDKVFDGYFLSENHVENGDEFHTVAIPKTNIKRIRRLKNGTFEWQVAHTPFYPEGGGQVCDNGFFQCQSAVGTEKFEILQVFRKPAGIVHICQYVSGTYSDVEDFSVSDLEKLFSDFQSVTAYVDMKKRKSTARHHTATHLLHRALQVILGDTVTQAGSLVTPHSLRFDFTSPQGLSSEDLKNVESLVNGEILKNIPVETVEDVSMEDAKTMGAQALFSEKYESLVRVLRIGNFSIELCGGTHVTATGQLGLFKILSESSVTSGVRRIEAVAGLEVLDKYEHLQRDLNQVAVYLKCSLRDIPSKLQQMKETQKYQEQLLSTLQNRLASEKLNVLLKNAFVVKESLTVVAQEFDDHMSVEEILLLLDKIKERKNHIGIFLQVSQEKGQMFVCVNGEVLKSHSDFTAQKILKNLAAHLGGRGGGKPDFARGSFTNIHSVAEVLGNLKEVF